MADVVNRQRNFSEIMCSSRRDPVLSPHGLLLTPNCEPRVYRPNRPSITLSPAIDLFTSFITKIQKMKMLLYLWTAGSFLMPLVFLLLYFLSGISSTDEHRQLHLEFDIANLLSP